MPGKIQGKQPLQISIEPAGSPNPNPAISCSSASPTPASTARYPNASRGVRKTCIEDLAVVGIDIGKDSFHLVGFDRSGQLVMRKQIKRLALNATFEQLPRCIVGMEACVMMRPHRWPDFSFGLWLTEAVARMPRNKAAVALANKLARTAWSLLRQSTRFDALRDAAMEAV